MKSERQAELRKIIAEFDEIVPGYPAGSFMGVVAECFAEIERLTEVLRDIAYNTSSSVPPESWPVDHYRWMMNRAVSLAANALIEQSS